MIIEIGTSEVFTGENSTPSVNIVGDIDKAKNLLLQLEGRIKGLSLSLRPLYFTPMPSGVELVKSYLDDYLSNFELAKARVINVVNAMKSQLQNAINSGIISPELISTVENVLTTSKADYDKLSIASSQIKKAISDNFDVIKYPNSAYGYFKQKNITVTPVLNATEKIGIISKPLISDETKKALIENTKTKAIENPIAVTTVLLMVLNMFKK